jgi:hypothetical protein
MTRVLPLWVDVDEDELDVIKDVSLTELLVPENEGTREQVTVFVDDDTFEFDKLTEDEIDTGNEFGLLDRLRPPIKVDEPLDTLQYSAFMVTIKFSDLLKLLCRLENLVAAKLQKSLSKSQSSNISKLSAALC